MAPEILILKAFITDRRVFDTYFQHFNLDDIDTPELKYIFKELHVYYQEHKETSLNSFYLHLKSKANLNDVHKILFQQCYDSELSDDILEVLNNYRERSLAKSLALLSFEVSEGRKTKEDILELVTQFDKKVEDNKEDFVTTNLEELYVKAVAQPGLRWRMQTLNRMLGSLRKGNFGFIFARPESGKTTFLSSEISFFSEQTKEPILWLNNEQAGEEVSLRIIQATLGLTREELFRDLKGNHAKYLEKTGDRIKIVDSANIHRTDVERLCDKLQPALIVFDQLDKIKGFTNDREDLRLGGVYIWTREIAKEYAPVIGVTQANGDAEGKRWLTMEQVSSAKTAKQAEADWILGIGKSNDEGMEYVRHLHLSKNKLPGDPDTDPNLRHGKMDCLIVPQIARFQDI